MPSMTSIDPLDARILLGLDAEPNVSVLQLARTLGISRNTVHARLQRLEREGVFLPFSQRIAPETLGYPVVGFVSLAASQSQGAGAAAALADIPEVVEVHATTGDADFLVKVVARDTEDLYRITTRILEVEGVVRSNTVVSLSEVMHSRVRPLLERRAGPAPMAQPEPPQAAARSSWGQ